MHPAFREMTLHDNRRELERNLRRASLRREGRQPARPDADPLLLRLSSVHDEEALHRLAELEGRPAPIGQHVVAEVGGAVVAALSLGTGSVLADPFRPTAHLVPLLELRAKQLADARPRRGSFPVWRLGRAWSRV